MQDLLVGCTIFCNFDSFVYLSVVSLDKSSTEN